MFKKGHIGYWINKKLSEKHKRNIGLGQTGFKHWNWKGGKRFDKDGYRRVYHPKHPFADSQGYIREHRLIMEKYLHRYLKPIEVVHHINENLSDNRIDNLKLFKNESYHRKFHNLNRKRNKLGQYLSNPNILTQSQHLQ